MFKIIKRLLNIPICKCCFCGKDMSICFEGYSHTCKKCGVNYLEYSGDNISFIRSYNLVINNKDYKVIYYDGDTIYKVNMADDYSAIEIPYFSPKGLTKEQFTNKIKTYVIFG